LNEACQARSLIRSGELAGVVEVVEEVLEVGVPVLDDGRLDVLDHVRVDALGVVPGLEQERRDDPEHGCLADPARAVPAQVAGDLAGAHGEPAEYDAGQVQVLQQGVQVGGEGVVVIADRRLAGPVEPAPVIGDDPVPGLQQHAFLPFPGVPVQQVAVDQHHRTAAAVIFVVDLVIGAVLGSDGDVRHGILLTVLIARRWPPRPACRVLDGERLFPAIVVPGGPPSYPPAHSAKWPGCGHPRAAADADCLAG
jgi:hypothetical protein